MKNSPIAYFLTFRTYGTWLPGDVRESVDKNYNQPNTPKKHPNEHLLTKSSQHMLHLPCILTSIERDIVLNAIICACKKYQWRLFAAHVRSNHIHVLVQSNKAPEHIMTQLKAHATRRLRKEISKSQYQKVWARHGSTKYIWREENLHLTLHYVIDEQGDRQACHYEDWYDELTFNIKN